MNEDQVSNDGQSNDGIVDNSKDVVSHESHKKLLAQRKADQEKLKAMQARLQELESKEAEIAKKEAELEEQKLKDEGNWKALLEAREARAAKLEEQVKTLAEVNKSYEDKFTNAVKLNAFKDAIGGTLKKNEYYGFVDTNKIALDPETGVVDEKSLKQYANDFVSQFKELIAFKNPVRLPSEAGDHSEGGLSYEEWVKLAQTNPSEAKKRMKDVKHK